jgi:hypothetical protein
MLRRGDEEDFMKRIVIGALLGALAFTTSVDTVHAAPKKKAKAAQEAPQSAEIAKAMGDLKWGMTREQVLDHFTNGIREKYKPLMAKASGAIEEDKLRAKMREELGKVKSSVVDFNGKKTGVDVSFLKGEFTHNNAESMFKIKEEGSESYYFFIQNKLWKWFKAFDASTFAGKSFEQFADAIQSAYGKSEVREGEAAHGGGKQKWLEWQDADTRLRAIDNKQFYGFYCLVFEDKATLKKLPQLRTAKAEEQKGGNALIDSVTSPEAAAESDNNPNVIDRITGKIRKREDAPSDKKGAPAAGADKPAAPPPSESGGVRTEDDPLKGLGI